MGRITGGQVCVLCGSSPITPTTGFLFEARDASIDGFMGVTTYFMGIQRSHRLPRLAVGLHVGRL